MYALLNPIVKKLYLIIQFKKLIEKKRKINNTVLPSHNDKVLSAEAVKIIFEKCKNSTVFTESACPLSVYRQRRLALYIVVIRIRNLI